MFTVIAALPASVCVLMSIPLISFIPQRERQYYGSVSKLAYTVLHIAHNLLIMIVCVAIVGSYTVP